MRFSRGRWTCRFAVFFLFNTPGALAQTQTTGGVQGFVHESGRPDLAIQSATVTVVNEETGLRRATLSAPDGSYFVSALPPGTYTVTAEKAGYEKDVQPELSVISGFPVRLSKVEIVRLPPIALHRANAPAMSVLQNAATSSSPERLVNTINATRGATFDRMQLMGLPLPGGRSFDELALLAPGVVLPPEPVGSIVGPGVGPGVGASGQFVVNGLRSRSNNFTVDGSDNDDSDIGVRRQGFTALVPQPIESIQEFAISTLLPDPQFARTAGAQVNAVSRSGANTFHGNLYGFLTDQVLNARDFFDLTGGPPSITLTRTVTKIPILNAVPDTPKVDDLPLGAPLLLDFKPLVQANPVGDVSPFRKSIVGAEFGGPILRDKAHFFVSFEQQAQRASKERHFMVPTVAERGIFSSGETGFLEDAHELIFGITRFIGHSPTSNFGQTIFSLFPFPNNPRGPYGPNDYTEQLPADSSGRVGSLRFDQENLHLLDMAHAFSARYNITDDATDLPVTGEALFSSTLARTRTQDFALNFSSTISVRSASQLRLSFGRTTLAFDELRDPYQLPSAYPSMPFLLNTRQVGFEPVEGTDYQTFPGNTARGFDGYCGRNFSWCTGPLGQAIVSGYSPIGADVRSFPQSRASNVFQVAETVIHTAGRHRVAAGFDIRRMQSNSRLDRLSRPVVYFTGALDTAQEQLSRTGTTPGIFLGRDFAAAGVATSFTQALAYSSDPSIALRSWEASFFLADVFRLRPRLSLTFDVQYQLNTVPVDAERRIERSFTSLEVQDFISLEKQGYGTSGLRSFWQAERGFIAEITTISEATLGLRMTLRETDVLLCGEGMGCFSTVFRARLSVFRETCFPITFRLIWPAPRWSIRSSDRS